MINLLRSGKQSIMKNPLTSNRIKDNHQHIVFYSTKLTIMVIILSLILRKRIQIRKKLCNLMFFLYICTEKSESGTYYDN